MFDVFEVAVPVEAFVAWTQSALAPHGFAPGNALVLLGVCRDELMFTVESAVQDAWGPAFDISSLGAMVFLGSSGMSAAAHHAPGIDGRRRFLLIVLPHIGVDTTGAIGWVERPGQDERSSACGALAGLQHELAAGAVPSGIDHDDLEMSLLRLELLPRIPAGPVPDLAELTEIARRCATDELIRLAGGLVRDADADVAVVSGLVVHRSDGDHVIVAEAWITLRDDGVRVALALPA